MVLLSPLGYETKAYLATPMDEVEIALVYSYLSEKYYRILPFLQFVCQFQATIHILELVASFCLSLGVLHVRTVACPFLGYSVTTGYVTTFCT